MDLMMKEILPNILTIAYIYREKKGRKNLQTNYFVRQAHEIQYNLIFDKTYLVYDPQIVPPCQL